jgi:hypothetical protein
LIVTARGRDTLSRPKSKPEFFQLPPKIDALIERDPHGFYRFRREVFGKFIVIFHKYRNPM